MRSTQYQMMSVNFVLAGSLQLSSLQRYAGCPDCLARYVMVAILKTIRCVTGSQCSWRQASVALADQGNCRTTRAN